MKKMKDILKRKVSVGLVAVMLVSQTPVTAFASEMPEFKTEQTLKTENLISEPTEDEPAEAEEILLEDVAGALSAQEVPSDENHEPGEDTESEVVENEESAGEDGYTEVSTWDELQKQLNAGGNVKLTSDVTAGAGDSGLEIPSGEEVTLDLNGHTIDANNKFGVIKVNGNGILTLTDSSTGKTGKLTGGNTNGHGGGVYVMTNGRFTMEGGTISGCSAGSGGGVFVEGGVFSMNGGTISDCSADYGGGVAANISRFTMKGGTISSCNAYMRGGGVYVKEDSEFTMTGGTISGCSAYYGVGGVYVDQNSTFTISGTPVIRGNKKDVSANNVVLDGGKTTITVTGELTTGAEIWVNADKGVAFAKKEGSYNITDTDLAKFHSDTDSSLVAAEDSDGSVKFFTPWEALQVKFNNASTVAGSPTRITLTGSVTADTGDSPLLIPEGKHVTLDLNGHTIDRGLAVQPAVGYGNVITVKGNLTLDDSSDNENTPEYDGTGKLTGGNNNGYGGGVDVSRGTFTMNGGTISGCSVTGDGSVGGGVYVGGGTFTMNGGAITG